MNIKKSQVGQDSKTRTQKLQQIDARYRSQIQLLYSQAKDKNDKSDTSKGQTEQTKTNKNYYPIGTVTPNTKQLQSAKSASTLNLPQSQESSKISNSGQEGDKVRASTFLKAESSRTIEILRRQNETKELRIRELTNKCQNLVQKLKKTLTQEQFQAEMETLRQFSDSKMERLEHLFKIKHEQMFFKIKLQVIGLLQEFGVSKDELAEFNDVISEGNLFSVMTRKLKNKLRDFRSRQQESSFQMQKDRILNQKQEERIHFLTETNEILKLSEQKMKGKVEDLKGQLNEYLQTMRLREEKNEQNENDLFKVRKMYEELQTSNQKLVNTIKEINEQKEEEKKVWQLREREMKSLLNNYLVEKKKLENQIEGKNGELEDLMLRLKFIEQQNERLNRELMRLKERFDWLQKEKESKIKEVQEEKDSIIKSFNLYKLENNQGIILELKVEIEEGLKKVEQYQRNYQRVVLQLEEERRLLDRSEEQAEERYLQLEQTWINRLHQLEQIKDEQLEQINIDCQNRINEVKEKFSKTEQLLKEEMQARLKAQLAEKDRKSTAEMIELETENQQLRRGIKELEKVIEVKESLINVIDTKRRG